MSKMPSAEVFKQNVYPPDFDNELTRHLVVAVLACLALLSLSANSLIMHAVRANQSKRMRNTTNFLIVNMAFGDFLVTIFFTGQVSRYMYYGLEWNDGPLERVACKLFYYTEIVSVLCSVFSLVGINLDRFIAIVYPLRYKCNCSWIKFTIPSIWIASIALPFHLIFGNLTIREIPEIHDNKTYVTANDATYEASLVASLGYVLPHVAMVAMNVIILYKLWTRRRPGAHVAQSNQQTAEQRTAKRVTLMIFCILIVFNFCWFPSFYVICFVHFMKSNWENHSVEALIAGSCLAVSNGPLNVIIYGTFCQNFRAEFKFFFKKVFRV